MFLIFGLGNPGARYQGNRHNVGFRVVDKLAHSHSIALTRTRYASAMGDGQVGSDKVILLKPQTYMNRSGRSVAEAMGFYQLEPSQLIVVYDEVDLPFGRLKVKVGGGHAGHNGIRSIIADLGQRDFVRIRVGIGRPPGRQPMSDYVLRDFGTQERDELEILVQEAADAVVAVVKDGPLSAMNQFNRGPSDLEGS